MKRVILNIIGIIIIGFSAKSQADTITSEIISYGIDDYIEKCTDIPVVRNINGGTVFNITYEGDWTLEMKGSFEYACKIWEENIPNCPPINICAQIGTIRGGQGQKALSQVTLPSYIDLGYYNDGEASLGSQIKAVVLKEYITQSNMQFVDGITDLSFFDSTDFTIKYNISMLDEFSYSLYSTPTDKYDFVTLALRDIAKGLGVYSKIRGSASSQIITNTGQEPNPFEKLIWKAIGTKDPQIAYINATQGHLSIWGGDMKLYAPSEWVDGLSLNTFIPDSTMKLTELLSYQFGKGSVIRNISYNDYPQFFTSALGWWGDILTGGNTITLDESGTTENVVPYGGNITIDTSVTMSNNVTNYNNRKSRNITNTFDLSEYCEKYHPAYRPTTNNCQDGWSVSVLKKDGTWDVVYDTRNYYIPLNVNMSDLIFNYSDSVYSRTCDGYLRCRATQSYSSSISWGTEQVNNVTYFALDYLPQQTEMEFAGVISSESARSINYDDYFRDVKINIKNLEGTSRIIVEQLDEGNTYPYQYEITDFKKGYFVATVDKEFYTHLTLVAYNNNGSTRSETLEIAPLEPVMDNYAVQMTNNTIIIQNVNDRISTVRNLTSYEIKELNSIQNRTTALYGKITNNNAEIDISQLAEGVYVLNYYDNRNNKYSFKFKK